MIEAKEVHCNCLHTIANRAIGLAAESMAIVKIIAQPTHDSEHDFVAVIADAMDELPSAFDVNAFESSKENHLSLRCAV